MSNINYISAQLIRVAPLPVDVTATDQFKIQIHSASGKTNWLNITGAQFKAIELVLLGEMQALSATLK